MPPELITQQRNIKRNSSVEKFRDSVRTQYKERLREERNNGLNKRRDLFNRTLSCIHESLTPHEQILVETVLLNTYGVLALFDEVEKELKYKDSLYEAQQHELLVEEETNSILDNLLDYCNICDKPITNTSDHKNNTFVLIVLKFPSKLITYDIF